MQALSKRVLDDLRKPYPAVPRGDDTLFAQAIGVSIPQVQGLIGAIDNDMDPSVHGVGWWVGHPVGDKRRILISDHLLQCVRSIERNLVEAKLHLLSLEHCEELDARLTRHMVFVRQTPGRPPVLDMEFPKRENAVEDLPRVLGDMHRVGFFRAIGSTLDCLGAAIVGVLGLPADLLKSDMGRARESLHRTAVAIGGLPALFLRAFRDFLQGAITSTGPVAWLEWTLDMRNMLVHRARRFQFSSVRPRNTGIVSPNGLPQVLSETITHLPRSPAHSDVEVMIATTYEPVLSEHAMVTIGGALASTLSLVDETAGALVRAWTVRRASPSLIVQPHRQWAQTPATPVSPFSGYAPGAPVQMNAMLAHPDLVRRLKIAALSDTDRHKWSSFT